MKKIILIFLAFLLHLNAKSQNFPTAFLYGSNGIITTDSITRGLLLDVKGIDGIVFAKKLPSKIEIIRFEMLIISEGKSVILKNDSNGLLTPEMKDQLKAIKYKSELYFQGIHGFDTKTQSGAALQLIGSAGGAAGTAGAVSGHGACVE